MLKRIKYIVNMLLELLYPRKCILCRSILAPQEDAFLCQHCHTNFLDNNREYIMAKALSEDSGHRVIALFPHTGDYREAVLRWKYHGIRKYAKGFAQICCEELHLFEHLNIELLIPVPLSPDRRRKRGFNQALDLALEIRRNTEIEVYDCLRRTRNTKPQSSCDRASRLRNIKGSIEFYMPENRDCISRFNNGMGINHIALIDDIYTTGSTIETCKEVLKQQYLFRNTQIDVIVITAGDFYDYRGK